MIPPNSLQWNRVSSPVEGKNSDFLSSCARDLRVPIVFQQGSQASSCGEAWNSTFHQVVKGVSGFLSRLGRELGLFSRCATWESALPLCCDGILRVPFKLVQENEALSRVEEEYDVLLT